VTEPAAPGTSGGPPGTSGARDDLTFLAVAAAVIVVVVTFNSLNVAQEYARVGRRLDVWEPVVWEASSALVILALLPPLIAFTRRVWPPDPPYGRKFALHLMAAVLFSLAHVASMGPLRALVYALLGERYDALGPLGNWPYELRKDILIYAVLVSTYIAWRLFLARGAPQAAARPETLEVRDGARRHFVTLAEVQWVEAAGNYVELHRGGAPVLHRASLAEMERRLTDAGFVRIHRSRLVRRDAVAGVESKPAGDFVVRLRDGRELAGSRRYRKPLLAD
jgi:hypothetical protein